MQDLAAFIDLPGLKAALAEMGCIIPEGFTIDVERHMRQLVLRYKPAAKKVWKDLSSVNVTQRRFFSNLVIIEWENYFVIWDNEVIRGWRKEILKPKKVCNTEHMVGADWDVAKKELRSIGKILDETGVIIKTEDINRFIPRSRAQRHGQYEYVRITLGKGPEVTYSPDNTKRKKTGYLRSFYGKDYLLVFGKHVEALFPTPGRLLLKDDDFFLYSRR